MKILKRDQCNNWWDYKRDVYMYKGGFYSHITHTQCWDLWVKAVYVKENLTYYWYEIL